MSAGLQRDDIRNLFDDLSEELARRSARADLFLVGGAAIAVAYADAPVAPKVAVSAGGNCRGTPHAVIRSSST